MRHELQTEIEIHATPESVWSVLIDLDSQTKSGFEAMSAALKTQVEASSGAAS